MHSVGLQNLKNLAQNNTGHIPTLSSQISTQQDRETIADISGDAIQTYCGNNEKSLPNFAATDD